MEPMLARPAEATWDKRCRFQDHTASPTESSCSVTVVNLHCEASTDRRRCCLVARRQAPLHRHLELTLLPAVHIRSTKQPLASTVDHLLPRHCTAKGIFRIRRCSPARCRQYINTPPTPQHHAGELSFTRLLRTFRQMIIDQHDARREARDEAR